MPARPVKAFRQGSRKNEKGHAHRSHRSKKGGESEYKNKRSRRFFKSKIQEDWKPESAKKLRTFKQDYNNDPVFRQKLHYMAKNQTKPKQ